MIPTPMPTRRAGLRLARPPLVVGAALVAMLALTACSGGSAPEPGAASDPPAEPAAAVTDAPAEPAETGATGSAEPAEPSDPPEPPEESEYADCPAGVLEQLNALSSGGSEWELGAWSQTDVGQRLDVPVPSCTAVRGSEWVSAFWVGGDAVLAEQIGAAIAALGVPAHEAQNPAPGAQTWGSDDTGFVSVNQLTPGDMSHFISQAFDVPTIELELLGDPLG